MIRSDLYASPMAHERNNVRRKRFQEGSLQLRKQGKRKVWAVLYRVGGIRKYYTLGPQSRMNKSQAQEKQAEFMKEVNALAANAPDPNITFGDFLEAIALPFYRSKWKRSTASKRRAESAITCWASLKRRSSKALP